MTEKMIIDAYCRIRTIDNTIPNDVLDFMKDAAIEKLRKHFAVGRSEQLTCECVELGSTECNKINDKWICCKCNRPLAG